jgi:hypothetical protein
MIKSNISLILFSAFLLGCSTTSPKISSVTKPDVAPLNLRSQDWFDQCQISLESGLRYHAPQLFEVSPPHQSKVAASSADYSLDYTDSNSFALFKIIARCHTPSAFNGSPPHQPQIVVSPGDNIRLDCRGRDMSLIDDAATK